MNLALGLIGALIGGRWGEKESALAVAKKLDALNSPYDEKRLLEQNKRMQKLNNAPPDFPGFIREGFDVKVITDDRYVKAESGLIYLDLIEGEGKTPSDGQQV
jgi:FKBP-type peptidyl-prolyl cis-trans isomerase